MGGENTGQLDATVDVTEIEIKKISDRVYEAYAIANVACPICDSLHSIKRVLELSSRVLLQLRLCATCGRELDLCDEITRFTQVDEKQGTVVIRGRLYCTKCSPREAEVSTSVGRAEEGISHGFSQRSTSTSTTVIVQGSAIINSPGAIVNEISTITTLISEIYRHRSELALPPDKLADLEGAIETIREQVKQQNPDRSMVRNGLRTLRNVAEGAVGSVIAASWLPMLTQLLQ